LRKIKDKEHLVKDESNGAIINTDRDGYLAYKQRKITMKAKQDEITELKTEVFELKGMVKELMGRI
tara:strand:+ start:451 stop:648 length:198 start_codon:yes stop_codon:yes gene_type:complete